jgi:hypothetical protein
MAELEADGLAGDAIVSFFLNHGQAVPRAKSWRLESSRRVLFVIRFPERYERLSPAEPGQIVDSVPIASLM